MSDDDGGPAWRRRAVTLGTAAAVVASLVLAGVFVPWNEFLSSGTGGYPQGSTGEAEGWVKGSAPSTNTILVSSGFLGLSSVTLFVSPDTLIMVAGKEGGFDDLHEGRRVRAAYEARPDGLHAKSIEVIVAGSSSTAPAARSAPGAADPSSIPPVVRPAPDSASSTAPSTRSAPGPADPSSIPPAVRPAPGSASSTASSTRSAPGPADPSSIPPTVRPAPGSASSTARSAPGPADPSAIPPTVRLAPGSASSSARSAPGPADPSSIPPAVRPAPGRASSTAPSARSAPGAATPSSISPGAQSIPRSAGALSMSGGAQGIPGGSVPGQGAGAQPSPRRTIADEPPSDERRAVAPPPARIDGVPRAQSREPRQSQAADPGAVIDWLLRDSSPIGGD